MSKRTDVPKVNAGSMADIAFLLLIFFLVTTVIETNAGLDRRLPRWNDNDTTIVMRYERNVLAIFLDSNGKLMANNNLVQLKELKTVALDFIDNGGSLSTSEEYCSYCKGERSATSSDNPAKAVISLASNRETSYGAYISVQNELVAAYNELRNREAQRLFKMNFTDMETQYGKAETSLIVKKELKERIVQIQKRYPLNIIDAPTITKN
ncbi:MAG: biopolymer transporter ExbD [Flavobacteriaceae bacterium]|nr:MAG: biopolymer transporter ExbD [Flavobacteriaceae bacterium]